MRYLLFTVTLIASLLFNSCRPTAGSAPISKKEMVSILVDIHVAQATVRRTDVPFNQMQKNMFYKGILDRHGISESEFDSALSWYARNTDDYKQVYKAVSDTLDKRRLQLDQQ